MTARTTTLTAAVSWRDGLVLYDLTITKATDVSDEWIDAIITEVARSDEQADPAMLRDRVRALIK